MPKTIHYLDHLQRELPLAYFSNNIFFILLHEESEVHYVYNNIQVFMILLLIISTQIVKQMRIANEIHHFPYKVDSKYIRF